MLVLGSEALHASDALLDDHRIPGQVVVDQHVRDLKVDAFGPRLGRHDDVAIRRILPEPLDGLLIAFTGLAIDEFDLSPPFRDRSELLFASRAAS